MRRSIHLRPTRARGPARWSATQYSTSHCDLLCLKSLTSWVGGRDEAFQLWPWGARRHPLASFDVLRGKASMSLWVSIPLPPIAYEAATLAQII